MSEDLQTLLSDPSKETRNLVGLGDQLMSISVVSAAGSVFGIRTVRTPLL
jgi:hypothetical protein